MKCLENNDKSSRSPYCKRPQATQSLSFSAAHPSLDRYARINPACMNIHVFTFPSSMTVILTPPAGKKKKKKIQIIESCSVWLITTRALSHFLGHQRSSKSTCIISKHPPSRGLLSILGHGQFLVSPTPSLLPQNRAQSSAKSLVPRPPTRPYTLLTSCHSTTTNNQHTHTHIILLGDAWA